MEITNLEKYYDIINDNWVHQNEIIAPFIEAYFLLSKEYKKRFELFSNYIFRYNEIIQRYIDDKTVGLSSIQRMYPKEKIFKKNSNIPNFKNQHVQSCFSHVIETCIGAMYNIKYNKLVPMFLYLENRAKIDSDDRYIVNGFHIIYENNVLERDSDEKKIGKIINIPVYIPNHDYYTNSREQGLYENLAVMSKNTKKYINTIT